MKHAALTFNGPPWLVRMMAIIGNAATVVSLILLYLEYSRRLELWDQTVYMWVDTALCAVMMSEWFALLWWANDRRAYVRARWIDLLASLPLLLIARPLRIIRLLRVLRLLRGVALFRRAMRPWEAAIDMTLLRTAALAATTVILIAAVVITDLERDNPALNSFDEALWWAIVTSTTVGYGDRVPITGGGQFVAVVLMILGIGLFGTLAATLTSAVTAGRKRKVSHEDLLERIESLHARLDSLEKRISAASGTPATTHDHVSSAK